MSEDPSNGNAEEDGMVKCVITGRMVPADEAVTIQGYTVCAEGKEQLLERLKSGELAPGEMEHPTVMRRFGCILLDVIVLWVMGAVIAMGIGGAIAVQAPEVDGLPGAIRMQGIIILIVTAMQVLYFGLLHGTRGQTLGKMAGKIKVVNLDGSPIGMTMGFLRALFYIGGGLVTGAVFLVMADGIKGREDLGTISIINVIPSVYILISAIIALVDRSKQRAIHDLICRTRVIMT